MLAPRSSRSVSGRRLWRNPSWWVGQGTPLLRSLSSHSVDIVKVRPTFHAEVGRYQRRLPGTVRLGEVQALSREWEASDSGAVL